MERDRESVCREVTDQSSLFPFGFEFTKAPAGGTAGCVVWSLVHVAASDAEGLLQ